MHNCTSRKLHIQLCPFVLGISSWRCNEDEETPSFTLTNLKKKFMNLMNDSFFIIPHWSFRSRCSTSRTSGRTTWPWSGRTDSYPTSTTSSTSTAPPTGASTISRSTPSSPGSSRTTSARSWVSEPIQLGTVWVVTCGDSYAGQGALFVILQ